MAARGGYKGGTGKAAFQNAPGTHIAAFFNSWIKSPLASVKCRYGANTGAHAGRYAAAPVQLVS